MRIIVDVGPMGEEHFIETDPLLYPTMADPTNPTQQIDAMTLLQRMNGRPDLREVGGWNVINQLKGEDRPYTRWERLVRTVQQLPSTDPLALLQLK
jgi:hypothetical protein